MTKTYRVSKEIPKGYVYCASMDFLEQLIKNGYLEEVGEKKLEEKIRKIVHEDYSLAVTNLAKAHVKEAVEKAFIKQSIVVNLNLALKAIEEC